MKTRSYPIGVTAAAVLLTAVPALAFNPQPEPPAFGMVHLARTQTAVLNVVLTPVPEDGQPPCVLDLSFVDANGRPFHDAAGQVISKRVELSGNAAAALLLRGQDAVSAGLSAGLIRGFVTAEDADPTDIHCPGLAATLEIVDFLGATRVLYAPIPDDNRPTPDDGLR